MTSPINFGSLANFRLWLRLQPSSRTFRPNDDCKCPIAQYLSHLNEREVTCGTTVVWDPVQTYPKEASWITTFIREFDKLDPDDLPPSSALGVLSALFPESP